MITRTASRRKRQRRMGMSAVTRSSKIARRRHQLRQAEALYWAQKAAAPEKPVRDALGRFFSLNRFRERLNRLWRGHQPTPAHA